jgi:alkanesulfonate monooxygenase SsuD/methylene tetrahydromethanopterin reductase-like flavin-dependent oxidoreductase (luciferase family)
MLNGGSERMRIGVLILPAASWKVAEPAWRLADELGFDHAWTYDHIAWRDLVDRPWYAAFPTLAAAALATRRIVLGPLVCSPNFRHPVPLAKEAVTLDDISGGRLVLGVGAGAVGPDATVLGREIPPSRERADRFDEFVELLDAVLRQRSVDYAGAHYAARSGPLRPGCIQQPRVPLAIAASGPRGMRLAARYADIWVTNGSTPRPGTTPPDATPALVAEQVELLTQACAAERRDPATLRKLLVNVNRRNPPLVSASAFEEAVESYRECGVTDLVVPFPRREAPFAGELSVLEEVADRLRASEAGAAERAASR